MKVKDLRWVSEHTKTGGSLTFTGVVGGTVLYEVYCLVRYRSHPWYIAYALPMFGGGTEHARVFGESGGEWEKLEDCQKACQAHFDKVVLDVYNKVGQFVEEDEYEDK